MVNVCRARMTYAVCLLRRPFSRLPSSFAFRSLANAIDQTSGLGADSKRNTKLSHKQKRRTKSQAAQTFSRCLVESTDGKNRRQKLDVLETFRTTTTTTFPFDSSPFDDTKATSCLHRLKQRFHRPLNVVLK